MQQSTIARPASLTSEAIAPYRVAVPQAEIDALKARLATTRFPEAETVSDWSQGVPLAKARALVDFWREHYDWRAFEQRLNGLPQFRTEIDGLGIHFLHIRSPHEDALPLLLTHGWPGSVTEFLKVIDPLTNPTAHGGQAEDAFHLVIPSLPGFGFSDKPFEQGWTVPRIGNAWATLMARLGYDRWLAQGGDWGSVVTHVLAQLKPSGLIAAHVTWPFVHPEEPPANPTPAEEAAFAGAALFADDQIGYFRQMGTRPQTIGYALADSPVGQATWIYEKFQAWSDNGGDPEDAIALTEMLDDISLYWFTNSAASSSRIYWENVRHGPGFNLGPIELPMAATVFPREIWRTPKAWAEKMWSNLFYWSEPDRGGHFAALEQPSIFVEEMRNAFRQFR